MLRTIPHLSVNCASKILCARAHYSLPSVRFNTANYPSLVFWVDLSGRITGISLLLCPALLNRVKVPLYCFRRTFEFFVMF